MQSQSAPSCHQFCSAGESDMGFLILSGKKKTVGAGPGGYPTMNSEPVEFVHFLIRNVEGLTSDFFPKNLSVRVPPERRRNDYLGGVSRRVGVLILSGLPKRYGG